LIDVLTVSKWRDQLRRHRVRLCGVRIDGTIDLSDTDISSELWVAARGIKGNLILASSHWDRLPGAERIAVDLSPPYVDVDRDWIGVGALIKLDCIAECGKEA
jgi:predicted flavoprotein YhiN